MCCFIFNKIIIEFTNSFLRFGLVLFFTLHIILVNTVYIPNALLYSDDHVLGKSPFCLRILLSLHTNCQDVVEVLIYYPRSLRLEITATSLISGDGSLKRCPEYQINYHPWTKLDIHFVLITHTCLLDCCRVNNNIKLISAHT